MKYLAVTNQAIDVRFREKIGRRGHQQDVGTLDVQGILDRHTGVVLDVLLETLEERVDQQLAGLQEVTRTVGLAEIRHAKGKLSEGTFGGHVIEHCDVFDTVKETGDHGSFNSWGRDRFWHLGECDLKEHPDLPLLDAQTTTILRNNRWRCDHGWDIDLDDGSTNYHIYNNLCLAGGIKLREGYFRKVDNNIMVDWTFCPHVWYPDCHTSFQRNIIWRDGYAPAGMKQTDQGERGGGATPVSRTKVS